MKINEVITEGSIYDPFLKQCSDLIFWLKTEFVKARMTETKDDVLSKYISNMIKQAEVAVATGKASSARRIMRAAIPNNQVLRDAITKSRARPAAGGWEESKRRTAWLKAVRFGKEAEKKLNFDTRLDVPPKTREQVEADLKRIADLKAAGKIVPFDLEMTARFNLARLDNEDK